MEAGCSMSNFQTRNTDEEPGRSRRIVAERYALVDLIGVGGSAEVYRAWDQVLHRQVAVKLYLARVSGPDLSRQQRELALMSELRHPHLVELLDAGESDGRAFLVMPLVEGTTLAERLRGEPLPAAEAVAVGGAVADALSYIHAHGITHRDVKPANILLGDRAMLSDFGIAQRLDATRITASGYLLGTASYMAPEQVQGQPVGPPADVYALGLVILEALTGRREYDGPPIEAAVARLARAPLVPAELPRDLGDLLRAMTATDPDSRPIAGIAARQLRGARDDIPPLSIAAPPGQTSTPTTLRLARRRPQRHRVLALALAGVLLLAALAISLLQLGPAASVLPPTLGVSTPPMPPPGQVLDPARPGRGAVQTPAARPGGRGRTEPGTGASVVAPAARPGDGGTDATSTERPARTNPDRTPTDGSAATPTTDDGEGPTQGDGRGNDTTPASPTPRTTNSPDN
jgi:serine/threonine protein kinase